MEYIYVLFSGMVSFGYTVEGISKYLSFKKFKNNGYIDDYHLIEGKLSSKEKMSSLLNTHKNNEILIKQIIVKIGTIRSGVTYVPVFSGAVVNHIPFPHDYTDWRITHNNLYWVNNIFINDKISLILKKIIPFFPYSHTLNEKSYERARFFYK